MTNLKLFTVYKKKYINSLSTRFYITICFLQRSNLCVFDSLAFLLDLVWIYQLFSDNGDGRCLLFR